MEAVAETADYLKLTMEKPEWFFRQSGVIPYRWHQGQLQVLLVTTRRRRHWIIPKGIIEPDMSPAESAVNEAWEEAGLRGSLHRLAVGEYRYAKWGGMCTVQVFLFRVAQIEEDWPEAGIRWRQWLSVEEAAHRVREPEMGRILERLPWLVSQSDTEDNLLGTGETP
ncbi:hypothetical protein DESUT3_38890 [Desulfuromonas versatilis]|uniref:Nudix hydrolase domain-containing protein n=1 Tax=Desulfuromonas versatilis TaxID=2802975 RepID=A0ABN6E3A7_9BACT|nr:NUDIX hydrolase [Desulfuromonas versatilis]BCR06820.1 hypothetical protein DESUT3_38890 [Desulfuromonas versatilis]